MTSVTLEKRVVPTGFEPGLHLQRAVSLVLNHPDLSRLRRPRRSARILGSRVVERPKFQRDLIRGVCVFSDHGSRADAANATEADSRGPWC